MGTRSKTNVLDGDGNVIISIYRQNDGDFQHHGKDITNFLRTNRLAKQIAKETEFAPQYNGGMEDLAGKLFVYLTTKTKEVMPAPVETNDDFSYEYEIGFIAGWGLYAKGRNCMGREVEDWFPIYEKPGLLKLTNPI